MVSTKQSTKQWNVEIYISEQDNETRAEARLHTGDRMRATAVGTARRNPHDADVPEIGDELATARALAELAHRLLEVTAADLQERSNQPVHLEE